jgi:hypothetical protein
MEDRMKESFLKFYFLSFLQDFPLSSSYFHLSEEDIKYFRFFSNSSSFDSNSNLPSFLVNPLTSFLFSSSSNSASQQQQQQSVENSKTKKDMSKEDGSIDKEKKNLSCFSEVNYFYLVNELIRFLLLQINNELFEKETKSLNEWGALLLYEDILLLRKCYDRLILPYEQSSVVSGQQAEPNDGEEFSSTSSSTAVTEFLSMADRYHYHIRKTKKLFHKVMNIMRILTVDSPSDFKRYQYRILPAMTASEISATLPADVLKTKTEKQPTSSALSGYYDRENDDEFSEKEIRYLLSKRNEFSKDIIQKLQFK